MEKTRESTESLPTCRAPGLPICEPEDTHISVVEQVPYKKIEPPVPPKTLYCDSIDRLDELEDADDEAEEGEEEEGDEASGGQSTKSEELVLLEQIEAELLEKKQAVDRIGEEMALDMPECPSEDSCVNMELELQRGKVHPHIYKLQQENHQLRQQLSKAQLSCKAIDLSLKYLRNSFCRDLKAAAILQRRLDELNSFKLNVEHEQALCRQRYRHLEESKYDWVDCKAYLKENDAHTQRQIKKFVMRADYTQPKIDAVKLLTRAKRKAMYVHNALTSRMAKFGQWICTAAVSRESKNACRFNSDISLFIRRNEHLLVKEKH
ncbi:hypothetical protein AWZ03_007720 [Drosophila navojoa]|uniref:Uncharacterized protein n=1 Tax=Drosophila navojoa TaxID=7232 RepID=A0A484BDK9_DRONA|nr:uncharacterized protein LOC108660121 [Drosophila navojoa]TDG45865.1 hypothetical protein AWZ03_007720 [Drosophila navojoa]